MPDRWYLNLAPTQSEKNRGATIALRAKRNFFHRAGNTQRSVQWTVAAQDLQHLDPTLLDATVGTFARGAVTPEGPDHGFDNELRPGPATLVRYTVTAQKAVGHGGNNVAFQKQYETWRKVYYDVVCMEGTKAHYEAIKGRFLAAWAAVGYEFVEKRVARTLVNEDVTDRGPDVLLGHLYNGNLSESPYHVRIVIVRDIGSTKDVETTWRMDEDTQAGTGITRVWSSAGPTVHYESPIQAMDAQPMQAGVVRVIGDVAVPGPAVARVDAHTVAIDTSGQALAGVKAALQARRKVSLRATLNAARAKPMDLKLKLDHATRLAQPLQAGAAQVALAWNNANWLLDVTDNSVTFAAAPVVAATLTAESRAKFGVAQYREDGRSDVAAHVTRLGDHVVRLTVPDVQGAPALLASVGAVETGNPGAIRVHRLALALKLLHSEAAAQDAVDVEVKADNDAMVRYDAQADRIVIRDPARVFDAVTPLLNARLLYAGADVAIPPAAAARNGQNPKQVDFDLTHQQLAGPMGAFNQGDTLEFAVTLRSFMSVGGYSPRDDRHFVALSTRRRTPNDTPQDTQRNLLCALLHELGHAHGLTASTTTYPRANASKTNARYYSDAHGGVGTHCSYNAHLVPSGPSYGELPTASGQIYKHDGGGGKLCIMYHQLDIANMGDVFCDHCAEQLRLASTVRLP
jgi:hypothetical protein